jgi:hypothetical protein
VLEPAAARDRRDVHARRNPGPRGLGWRGLAAVERPARRELDRDARKERLHVEVSLRTRLGVQPAPEPRRERHGGAARGAARQVVLAADEKIQWLPQPAAVARERAVGWLRDEMNERKTKKN